MIHIAAKQAAKSHHQFRVGAVIVRHGTVISVGFNRVGHRSRLREFPSIHAEEAAIMTVLRQRRSNQLVNATIYITRILKNNTQALAKPCPKCMNLIQAVGIKDIIFSVDGQSIKRIKCPSI